MLRKSGMRIHKQDVTAFEVVELVLYITSLGNVISGIFSSLKSYEKFDLTLAVYLLTCIIFVFLIIQNYLNIRIVDEKYVSDRRGLKFIFKNDGAFLFFEKIIRLTLIGIIFLSSKYPIDSNGGEYAKSFIHLFSNLSFDLSTLAFNIFFNVRSFFIGFENAYALGAIKDSPVSEKTYYYIGCIFAIFLLNLLWMCLNILAVQMRKKVKGTEYDSYQVKSPYTSDLFSLLYYLGMIKTKDSDHIKFQLIDSITGKRYLESVVVQGNLLRACFRHSPVIRGQMIGIVYCVFAVLYLRIQDPFVAIFIGISISPFFIYIVLGDRFWSRLSEIFLMPVNYFR